MNGLLQWWTAATSATEPGLSDRLQIEAEIDEELVFHLERLKSDFRRRGIAAADADREAEKRFGNIAAVRRQCLAIQTEDWIMWQRAHLALTIVLLIAVLVLGVIVSRQQAQDLLVQTGLSRADAADLQLVATDVSKPDDARVLALRGLRVIDRTTTDFRTHNVIASMIELARSTKFPSLRAEIFRQLHGVSDPILEGPLMIALEKDSSADVRSEAAETLDQYLSSARVVEALQKAAANDMVSEVRQAAAESLRQRQHSSD